MLWLLSLGQTFLLYLKHGLNLQPLEDAILIQSAQLTLQILLRWCQKDNINCTCQRYDLLVTAHG